MTGRAEARGADDGTRSTEPGTLYIVSTPIGNLGDITVRALDVLRDVDRILAEDTRTTRVLLEHYGIRTPTSPFHERNEARSIPGALARLERGECLAQVTDAGTPLISDPGLRLVRAAWAAGHRVVPVPGPSALTAALAASGSDPSTVTFVGFLPRTGRERRRVLELLSALRHTGVLYEAPRRLASTLRDIEAGGGGSRQVVVARELTKRFEEFRRGTVAELAAYYEASPPRGEVVVIIEGREEESIDESDVRGRVDELRREGLSTRDIVASLVRDFGLPRNTAYRLAHEP